MIRSRDKRRGYHQSGWKQCGHQTSEDLCPHCYGFGCDPMSMSRAFQNRVHERLRKGLCVACGQPKTFCKCKSSYSLPKGTSCIQTHNNKKRRKAMAAVETKERVYKLWYKNQYLFENTIGKETANEIGYALYRHKVPAYPWDKLVPILKSAGFDPNDFAAGWAA